MFDTDQLTAQYGFIPFNHREPVFFPVEKKPVYDDRGREIPNYCRIERGDTGDTLAVHTTKYAMVPYEQNAATFQAAIERSGLPWRNMLIGEDMDANGARLFRQYLFPDTTSRIETRRGVRELALRIVTWDSYDGSSSFTAKGGFLDFVCANEAVSGAILGDYRFRHVGNIEERVVDAANKLATAAMSYKAELSRMAVWTDISLGIDRLETLCKALPQSNEKLVNYFLAEWGRQGHETLWDANQMLTSWATHGEAGRLPARTRSDRQKRVAALIECENWKEVEAA